MKDGSSFFNHFNSYLLHFLIHFIEFPENSRLFQLGSYLYESLPGPGGELGIVHILPIFSLFAEPVEAELLRSPSLQLRLS